MFRFSQNRQEPIVDVEAVEAIEFAIRSSAPVRYRIDEISVAPMRGRHTSRRSGVGIKRHNGSVMIEPDPWDA